MRREEDLVGEPIFEEVAMQRQRDGDVRTGPQGEVEISQTGQGCRPRVHDHERGAGPLRFADKRHEVDA